MKVRETLRLSLLIVAVVAAVSTAWTVDVQAQGASPGSQQMTPATGGMQQVEGTIKDLDRSGRTLTLDDGTTLTIPPTVQLPGGIKEGSVVKASFEERGGQKVLTSLEVEKP